MSITVIYYATSISDCTVYELMKKKSKPSSCWMDAGFENDLFRTDFVCYLI